jgi:predicted nuclease of predicted toxin-antitoxin system
VRIAKKIAKFDRIDEILLVSRGADVLKDRQLGVKKIDCLLIRCEHVRKNKALLSRPLKILKQNQANRLN